LMLELVGERGIWKGQGYKEKLGQNVAPRWLKKVWKLSRADCRGIGSRRDAAVTDEVWS
jgi:hypothetical protein